MYLKSLELIGFKSFANKTRLVFEPGITAIVGPNGCGKSNVSDAIRWVLGEQRPTALRGSAMSDVIFNGTDARKAVGMAEVSITFADCEEKLGTEYNEVTVTRRVFRSGEGQYFLNKSACRLRDIQRLFMGTGVGTTSYSVMAQGQIDAVLSSRPEDRRAVFEEASGITRFKADRKEALRKLEQTDANLVRLTDVIREVKRQIGSLQRQAGKARRYTELRGELRSLDVYLTTRRILELDRRAGELETQTQTLDREASGHHERVTALEARNTAARADLMEVEREIGKALEAAMQAQGRLNQARDVLRMNEQRVAEYRAWSQRDEREISETRAVHDAQKDALEQLADQLTTLETETRDAEAALAEARERYELHRREADTARTRLQTLRSESIERERAAARLQNELAEAEARERGTLLQRERLAAEKTQLARTMESLDAAVLTLDGEREALEDLVAGHAEQLAAAETLRTRRAAELKELQQQRAALQSQIAARGAQIQMLEDHRETEGEYPAGTRLLLDPSNPLQANTEGILGTLADHLSAPPDARRALEAALRPWLDAIVVRDAAYAATLLSRLLATERPAGTRMVSVEGRAPASPPRTPPALPRLLDAIRCSDAFEPAAARLLANVYLAPSVAEIPHPLPQGCVFVTAQGALVRDDGCIELWMPEGTAANPLARRMLAEDAREQLGTLELDLQRLDDRSADLSAALGQTEAALQAARRLLDESRRSAAQKEGELQGCRRDAKRNRERLDTVTWEHAQIQQQGQSGDALKTELAARLQGLLADRDRLTDTAAAQSVDLQTLEHRHAETQAELTEHRLRHSSLSQQTEHVRAQHRAGIARLDELVRMVQGRQRGLQSYEDSIARLVAESESVSQGLAALEADVTRLGLEASELRAARAQRQTQLDRADAQLHELRRTLDDVRNRRAHAEVQLAEARMRRQNHVDRLLNEHHVAAEDLHREAEPEWPDGQPLAEDIIDARVAELRGQIDALGPVNLVAIDEYRELEERHTFLVAQEDDLVKGKAQILDLIRRINVESSELFKATFVKANENFQVMFQKLFNGGTAQLVLLDSEDVLECGIDIIARPPGKRLQSVSLLSGGERTMTAVSLLFAIYKIKPSPFALLDELDAALDDANIGRFVLTLKEFLEMSQFVIITHNQHTIAGADIVYGVTMPEKGISRIVSMRLKQIGVQELAVSDPAAPPAPEPGDGPPRKRRRKSSSNADDDGAESPDTTEPNAP